jgi:V/A-type H+/Na+-transporting ATPase subunit G/H
LAIDAINEIKKAEAKAEELISKAQVDIKEILKNANKEAEEKYADIIGNAKVKAKSIMDEYIALGNETAEPILATGKKESMEILNISADRLQNAVKLVIERIVKSNGHS